LRPPPGHVLLMNPSSPGASGKNFSFPRSVAKQCWFLRPQFFPRQKRPHAPGLTQRTPSCLVKAPGPSLRTKVARAPRDFRLKGGYKTPVPLSLGSVEIPQSPPFGKEFKIPRPRGKNFPGPSGDPMSVEVVPKRGVKMGIPWGPITGPNLAPRELSNPSPKVPKEPIPRENFLAANWVSPFSPFGGPWGPNWVQEFRSDPECFCWKEFRGNPVLTPLSPFVVAKSLLSFPWESPLIKLCPNQLIPGTPGANQVFPK